MFLSFFYALRRHRVPVALTEWMLFMQALSQGLADSSLQRFYTLARALLSDAPVLLLDEPTAHLDPENAEALVRDVLMAADGRSVLLITHRPEGLDLVDEIVTLGSEP